MTIENVKQEDIIASDHKAPDICGPCGGKCCKRSPGSYLPSDFSGYEEFREMALNKKVLINHWEGYGDWDATNYRPGWFVQPALKTPYSESLFQPHWGGECSNLTLEGCSLPADKMPYQCRKLVPSKDNKCKPEDASHDNYWVATQWESWYSWIYQIIEELESEH